jgi:hypothetical protein
VDGQPAAGPGRADRGVGERRLTPFERALRERIRAEGPITVEAYMEACNAYYYATRDPLGAEGDFTTAPEISQMFGELVGAALADCWTRAGSPKDAVYAELGPGRGTLAADALRVMRRAGFAERTGLHMGQWLSIPMILGGLWLMWTANRRRVRVEPIAGSESVA